MRSQSKRGKGGWTVKIMAGLVGLGVGLELLQSANDSFPPELIALGCIAAAGVCVFVLHKLLWAALPAAVAAFEVYALASQPGGYHPAAVDLVGNATHDVPPWAIVVAGALVMLVLRTVLRARRRGQWVKKVERAHRWYVLRRMAEEADVPPPKNWWADLREWLEERREIYQQNVKEEQQEHLREEWERERRNAPPPEMWWDREARWQREKAAKAAAAWLERLKRRRRPATGFLPASGAVELGHGLDCACPDCLAARRARPVSSNVHSNNAGQQPRAKPAAQGSGCLSCGAPLPAKKRGRKREYCSDRCRQAAHRTRLV